MRCWIIKKLKGYYQRSARHQKEFIYLLENNNMFWYYTLLEFSFFITGISLTIIGFGANKMEMGKYGIIIMYIAMGMTFGSNHFIKHNLIDEFEKYKEMDK